MESNGAIKVLSFGHMISPEVRGEITKQCGKAEFFEIPFNLDPKIPVLPQVQVVVDHALEMANCGASTPFILLPGMSVPSALIVAMIHGKISRFPFIIELTKNAAARWLYRVKEVHDLDLIRSKNRERRFSK